MSDVIALPQDFQLVLRPNVSLSRDGFIILMVVFAAICLVAGGFFLALGAWPVFGFFGLDILLLYLAFRINYRRARRYEMLEMRDGQLVLSKVTPAGKVRYWVFDPYWVRVRPERESVSIPSFRAIFFIIARPEGCGGRLSAPAERGSLAATLEHTLSNFRSGRG